MRWSWTLFSAAGKRLYWRVKPQNVPGSTIAPHSIARCSSSSTGGNCSAASVELAALDRQVAGRQPAAHLAGHPRRGHRHDVRVPGGGFRAADGREDVGHVHVLQLLRPAAGKKMIEVLPRGAERLPQRHGLGPQPLRVRAFQLPEQLVVKGVAIVRDLLHQRGQGDGRVVRVRPIAADARAHHHRAGQHRRFLEEHLFAAQTAVMLQAIEHGVHRRLLQHKPPTPAGVVQPVHVPLAKKIVGPLVDGVVEVVGPGIERQLFQLFQREHRIEQQRGLGGVENGQGRFNQLLVGADRRARPADPKRDRAHPFVLVGLDLSLRAERGHGPMANEVVQLPQDGGHDPVRLVPRPALLEHRLARPANEERPKQIFVRLVEKQVAVELAVGRQHAVEHQPDHGLGLLHGTERLHRAVEGFQFGAQHLTRALATSAPRPTAPARSNRKAG